MPLVALAFPTLVDGSVGKHDGSTGVPGLLVQSAAAAIAGWLQEAIGRGAPTIRPVIVVPSPWMVMPLKRALRAHLATPGAAWMPPPIAALEGHAAAAWPEAGPVRSRHARLLAVANRLSQGGLPRDAASGADGVHPETTGWPARFQRASELVDLIDTVDASRALDALEAGSGGPGMPPAAGSAAAYLAAVAGRAGAGGEGPLGSDLRALAAIVDEVADESDPLRVQARQWPHLLRRWLDTGATVIRIGLRPLRGTGREDTVPDRGDRVLEAFLARSPALPLLDFHPQAGSIGAIEPVVAAAWPEVGGQGVDLPIGSRRRAAPLEAALRGRAGSPLLHARSREDEAALAAQWVHDRLGGGAESVAILVLDRWLARRCRALLERSGILIDDREGWALSTTVAAALVMAWLDFCREPDSITQAGPRAERVMMALLGSAFVAGQASGDLLRDIRRRQRLHRRGVVAPEPSASAAAIALAEQLAALASRQRRCTRLGEHLDCLRSSLGALGAMNNLQQDEAGRQLLALLDALPSSTTGRCRLEQFRALVGHALEGQRFHDGSIESPVRMIGLAEAIATKHDAVLVLGANDGRLPVVATLPPGIAESMRVPLGLKPVVEQARAQATALAWALAGAHHWVFTCRTETADGTLPSQFAERLAAIVDIDLASAQDRPRSRRVPGEASAGARDRWPMARPADAAEKMPLALSVGAIERLVGCPYEFLVTDVWQLSDAGEATEAPGKRELGIVVHETLLRFHREVPEPLDEAVMADRLRRITGEVIAANPTLRAARLVHLQEWYAIVPEYARRFRLDYADGWRFEDGEVKVEGEIRYGPEGEGRTIRIHGKYDRVDRRHDSRRVVDYKLQNPDRIRKRAGDIDQAAQLMLYSWLVEAGEAAYLAIDRKRTVFAAVTPAPAESLAGWREALAAYLVRLGAGEPFQALGSHCDRCRVRGICRQGHWIA